jgi:CubicO group peptidase (beta-lactamase class C family)
LSTPYPAASTSKAINATLIGMLVDDGLLAWDVPVRDYLPEFALSDPSRSGGVTLRDLILMRTGLPRHDWTWNSQRLPRPALLAALPFLELNRDFRACQQYNNLGPSVAGHAAERLTGKDWSTLVNERILAPLGMRESGFPAAEPEYAAAGHRHDEAGHLVRTDWFNAEAIAPAGGALYTTVTDFAKWASFNLHPHATSIQSLIASPTLAEIHRPQIAAGEGYTDASPEARYALGWVVDEIDAVPCLTHSGYLHDINNEVSVFPALDLGVVSVSNFGPPRFAKYVNNAVVRIWKGESASDALGEIKVALARYEQRVGETRRRPEILARPPERAAPRNLADYCGEYWHPGYGSLTIAVRGDRLLAQRPIAFQVPLVHLTNDRWCLVPGTAPSLDQPHPFDAAGGIVFEAESSGVSGLRVQLEPLCRPISFKRCGEVALPTG